MRLFRAGRAGRALDHAAWDPRNDPRFAGPDFLGRVRLGVLPADFAVSDLEAQPVLPRQHDRKGAAGPEKRAFESFVPEKSPSDSRGQFGGSGRFEADHGDRGGSVLSAGADPLVEMGGGRRGSFVRFVLDFESQKRSAKCRADPFPLGEYFRPDAGPDRRGPARRFHALPG